jgi:hypothetical protein
MDRPRYPPARAVAARLTDHFTRHAAAGRDGSAVETPLPDADAVEAMIDAAFWASLQREEGYSPEISLAFLPPQRAQPPLRLGSALPLGPRTLARLAPAVERPGIHLGVWREGGELVVWGTTRAMPTYCFVVEVIAPGLMVVKHRTREDLAKFQNVAVFEGEQTKMLIPESVDVVDHPAVLTSLISPEPPRSADDPVDLLLRLAVSMRAHKRGGTLLVVPTGTQAWRESIVRPIAYALEPPFMELADCVRHAEAGEPPAPAGALGRAVAAAAGLTAVDGATVIGDGYDLLAFGVKIGRREGRPRVERVRVSEPIEGDVSSTVPPSELGGTRHASAAQFAQDQQDSVVLVASQDGRFTVFAWSARDDIVHAHRVETLLL